MDGNRIKMTIYYAYLTYTFSYTAIFQNVMIMQKRRRYQKVALVRRAIIQPSKYHLFKDWRWYPLYLTQYVKL